MKWTILGTYPDRRYHNSVFEVDQGRPRFRAAGVLHYFENSSPANPLEVLVVFTTGAGESYDAIDVVGPLNSLPRAVLGRW